MTVYVLKVEGNIDYYSDVVGVYRSFESAQKWQRIEEDAAIEEGEIVEGRNERTRTGPAPSPFTSETWRTR